MQAEKMPEETKEAVKEKGGANRVVLVQTAVCFIMVLLIYICGKIAPQGFEFIKNQYNEIMSESLNADSVVSSVMGAAEKFMSGAAEKTPAEDEKESAVISASDGMGGEDVQVKDTAVAVMSSLGKNKSITVPVHGRISSEYGYRTNPINNKYTLHTGVDIAAAQGTNIVAAYNGVVKDVGVGNAKGKYVLMEHEDGTQTLYCHCSELLADEDTVIRAGEVIALVGSTGWSTGPHLHFEIHGKNGGTIDPLTVLSVKDGKI